jgi:hypothetical protein
MVRKLLEEFAAGCLTVTPAAIEMEITQAFDFEFQVLNRIRHRRLPQRSRKEAPTRAIFAILEGHEARQDFSAILFEDGSLGLFRGIYLRFIFSAEGA